MIISLNITTNAATHTIQKLRTVYHEVFEYTDEKDLQVEMNNDMDKLLAFVKSEKSTFSTEKSGVYSILASKKGNIVELTFGVDDEVYQEFIDYYTGVAHDAMPLIKFILSAIDMFKIVFKKIERRSEKFTKYLTQKMGTGTEEKEEG